MTALANLTIQPVAAMRCHLCGRPATLVARWDELDRLGPATRFLCPTCGRLLADHNGLDLFSDAQGGRS